MSGIALTSPVNRGSDPNVDVAFIGTNFVDGRVVIRVLYTPSGITKDYLIGPGGIESIASLVAAVPNFAGLRVAMLQHLQTLDPGLAGQVT